MHPSQIKAHKVTQPYETLPLSSRFFMSVHGGVTIFLTNGVKLTGKLSAVDQHSIILSRDGAHQLIQRSAIATCMPETAIDLADVLTDGEQAQRA